jgi:fluoroquinolone resistance protein
MTKPFFTTQKFQQQKITATLFPLGEYEACQFIDCDFSNFDLSGYVITNCVFTGCNLSMCHLKKTALRESVFKTCKLTGLRFDQCNEFLFSAEFDTSYTKLILLKLI